jgi:hypothetical protein
MLHLAVGIGAVIQISTVFVPFVRDLLGLTSLDVQVWAIVTIAVLGVWAAAEIFGWYVLRMNTR